MRQMANKAHGIPLLVEELTKTVLESGILIEDAEGYRLDGPLPPLAIPTTLQDSLMARLDLLGAVKEIAQVGAAIGREFSYQCYARSWAVIRPRCAQVSLSSKRPSWCFDAATRRKPL